MLTQIIEAGKLLAAMACEGTFTGVLSDMASKMFTARKNHATVAIASALESFCRSWTIALVDATDWTRHVWDDARGDGYGHGRGRTMIRGMVVVGGTVEVGRRRIRGFTLRGFTLHTNRAVEKETRLI